MVLVGLSGTSDAVRVNQLKGQCGTLQLHIDNTTAPFQYGVEVVAPNTGLALHGTYEGTAYSFQCPQGTMTTRIFGRDDTLWVYQLGIACSRVAITGTPGSWALQFNETWTSTPTGSPTSGTAFSDPCPANTVARTLAGRSGTYLRGLQLGCHQLSLTQLP